MTQLTCNGLSKLRLVSETAVKPLQMPAAVSASGSLLESFALRRSITAFD